jgi:hypothetical protein
VEDNNNNMAISVIRWYRYLTKKDIHNQYGFTYMNTEIEGVQEQIPGLSEDTHRGAKNSLL